MQVERRNVNFEFLRILAMLGVLMNHVFNYGLKIYPDDKGIATTFDISDMGGIALWSTLESMKLIVLVCVNCFVLISGYFLIDKTEFRLKGIWRVWSQTWFYSMAITVLFLGMAIEPFSWNIITESLTPVWHNTYWFVTSYLVLMLIAPVLAWMASKLTKKQYILLLGVGGIICFQFLLGQYSMDNNYMLLFCYLFLIGGYIRKYYESMGISHKTEALACAVLFLIMFGVALAKNIFNENGRFMIYAMDYHGLVLPFSIAVFLVVKQIKIPTWSHRMILWLAPLSFASYIIHTHPLVDRLLWEKVSLWLPTISPLLLPLACLGICIVIFLFCAAIEFTRTRIVSLIQSSKRSQ